MGFEISILPVIFFSILSIVLVTLFFKRFGAFRLFWVVWFMMLLSAIIPYVMVVGILPYDISRCLFGKIATNSKELHLVLDILYWTSFVLTWAINPLLVSYLRYPYSIGIKRRIWLTIRENLIFWGLILAAVFVGVIILFITNLMTISNILPLAISLANGYGLLVLCVTLGYGFIQMPRTIWQKANPASAYLYCLQDISQQTSVCSTTVADCDALLVLCQNGKDLLRGEKKKIWNDKGEPKLNHLIEIKQSLPIPERCKQGESKNKKIKKLRKLEWANFTHSQLEDVFELLEDITQNIEATSSYVSDASKKALRYLRLYNHKLNIPLVILKRIFAIIVLLVNLCCLWSEITLMFNIKLSLFYMLSHLQIPQIINIVFISTPILAYLMFVGSWTLRHFRIGSFFRFIVGHTNSNTLNYFSIILCRLGPTIGFHYMQQIGAYDSEYQKVMGVMNVVVFIGTKWNLYAPILLILIMIATVFQLFERIMFACGKDIVTYDTAIMNVKSLQDGEEVLCELESDAKNLIDAGMNYMRIMDHATLFKKPKREIEESLLSEPSSPNRNFIQNTSFY
ncbi:LMBR1 domain-containing protein 2 [Tritrichomonas musculus]|uniref:LMBR1 domain-containing protein 2 n=1 Tax=Tritrichomonas musculus TaxID=1915356 RepID=A0ABR2IL28_9EUKA